MFKSTQPAQVALTYHMAQFSKCCKVQ